MSGNPSVVSHSYPFIRRSFAIMLFTGLAFAKPAWAGDDDKKDFGQLGRELRSQYNAGNYEAALKTAEKMHEMRSSDMDAMYNMACLHCLLGHKDKAYEWLEKAIDAGFKDPDGLVNDGDFSRIRAEDRFRKIVRKLRNSSGADHKKSAGDDDEDAKPAKKKPEKKAQKEDSEDEMSVEAAAQKINELTEQLIQNAESKDYDKSLKIAKEAYELSRKVNNPTLRSMTAYNMACMHSLRKESDEAFKYLGECIDMGAGFARNMVSQMQNDSDLTNIRKDDRYAKLLAKAKKTPQDAGNRVNSFVSGKKFAITPPNSYNKAEPAPLLVVLHGHGENMEKATHTWLAAAGKSGAILLSVQGSEVMSDGVYEWGHNLDAIEETIMAAIDQAGEQYKIDKKRIVIGGFSQGGWVAYAMALRNPDTFRGIIPVAGQCKPESESAFKDDEVGKLRLYIMVGKKDSPEIIQSNEKAAKRFEKSGAKVSLNEYKNVAHEFPENADEELAKALEFILRD